MKDWDIKTEWRKRDNDFMVIVSHHTAESVINEWDLGNNRWAVYAFIYPEHPLFDKFDANDDMWQDAAKSLPLHCYPSFFMAHRADSKNPDKVTAFQVGADYNHLHDDIFSHYPADDFPGTVSEDAEKLFDHLSVLAGRVSA